MPTIAAIADFEDEISIANKSDSAISPKVTRFINKYEPAYLRELFGPSFAALFIAGLNPEVTDPVTPVAEKWTDLLTPNGYSLKLAIDNYIYYWYMRFEQTQSTGVGTVKTKNQNATVVSGDDKVMRAWFEMIGIGMQALKYLNDNASTYPEFTMPRWYNSFYWGWSSWEYSNDIFNSEWYSGICGTYRMPDIFIPLSKF